MENREITELRKKFDLTMKVLVHSDTLTGSILAEKVFYKLINQTQNSRDPEIIKLAEIYQREYEEICEANCCSNELEYNNGEYNPLIHKNGKFIPRYGRIKGEGRSWETLAKVENL